MYRLAQAMKRVSLLLTQFVIGGSIMDASFIHQPLRFYCYAIAVAVTVLALTCLKNIYKLWLMSTAIEIRIAHYPPYTSKYHPIEHRLFPHITRTCQGVIFDTVETVIDLIATVKTKTGLKVLTTGFDKVYQTGLKAAKNFKETMQIVFDKFLPEWNYTAQPQQT